MSYTMKSSLSKIAIMLDVGYLKMLKCLYDYSQYVFGLRKKFHTAAFSINLNIM